MDQIVCSKKASSVIFIHSAPSSSPTGPSASTAMVNLFITNRSQVVPLTKNRQSKNYVWEKSSTMTNLKIKENAFSYFVSLFHPIYSKTTSDHQIKSQIQFLSPLSLPHQVFNLLQPMQLVNLVFTLSYFENLKLLITNCF